MSENKKSTMELLVELQTATAEVEKALNEVETTAEQTDKLRAEVETALAAYNASVTQDAYASWNAQECPMRSMLTDRFIPGTKKVRYLISKDTGLNVVEINDSTTPVSLVKYATACGYGNFAKGRDWWTLCQAIAYIMANAFDRELAGENSGFAYKVDAAASTFQFGEDANPASNTSCIKALQMVFDAILPGVRANSHDVAYIRASMTKNGGVLKVTYGGTHKMADYIADAMHGRLTDKKYTTTA